jgi:hypothetical protein
MRVHLDVLGWLHALWGIFGLLTGLALLLIALGAVLSVADLGDDTRSIVPTVILLLAAGVTLGAIGVVMMVVGRALRLRRPGGRRAALAMALPNLLLLPFGTALGLYTYWTLVNDDARRAFGRPARASHTMAE